MAAALSILLLVLLASIAVAGARKSCPPLAPRDWARLPVPSFSQGNQVITDYDVSATNPNILYLTNGTIVLSSKDGGCSFIESFNLTTSGFDFNTDTASIVDVDLASTDGRKVLLAVRARGRVVVDLPDGLPSVPPVDVDNVDRPHVVSSSDGGATWTLFDAGLDEAVGPALSVASTPDSGVAYLLVDEAEVDQKPLRVFTPQRIYASTAGGAWQRVYETSGTPGAETPATPGDARLFSGIESDPRDPQTFWAYGVGGLYKTTDGGSNLAQDLLVSGVGSRGISGIETFPNAQGVTELIAYPTGIAQGLYSNNAGAAWTPFPDPEPIESAALAPGLRFATATGSGVVYYHFPQMPGQLDISSADEISGLQGVLWGKTSIVYGRTLNGLVRRVAPNPPPEKPWDFPEPEPLPGYEDLPPFDPLGEPPPAKLIPATQRVVLRPGETRTLEYRLLIPGAIKADVVFLADTTNTMSDEIEGLKDAFATIIDELGAAQIYAHTGLGQYRSYQQAPSYRTDRDIGPPDDDFRAKLDALTVSGGDSRGSDQETGLAALYNIATGEGSSTDGAFIAPDQEMHFRPGILHVIVHGTDEDPSPLPPNPNLETTVVALNGVGARHVGLAYVNSANALSENAGPPTASLQRLSSLTNAFATNEVECTGDGIPDILPGQPLVCEIPPGAVNDAESLGVAVANLIKGLPDKRAVRLEVSGGSGVVVGVLPTVYSAIDFRTPQEVIFNVTVTCPSGQPGGNVEMGLTATARNIGIADARLNVICQAVATRDAAPIIPPPFVVFPPQGPPPPPQPPQVTTTVNQLQAQTQAQSQAQTQVGLVAQRQAQPQVAMVKVLRPSENLARVDVRGDDLAFSGFTKAKHRDLPLYLASYVVAAAMGTAFGLLLRTRMRRSFVYAPKRLPQSNRGRRYPRGRL